MILKDFTPFTLNIRGKAVSIDRQQIMGIVNVTPDSFYAGSRTQTVSDIEARVRQLIDNGADCIDLGGYSSRPGADDITPEEETERLAKGMRAIRNIAPDVIVSIDTFRAEVARTAIEELGADMINDISGGAMDENMVSTVARIKVPYIMMHMRGTPATMQQHTSYTDVTADVTRELAERLTALNLAGVADVIVDPGFGFAKTLEQNFELLRNIDLLHVLGHPILVGISRKSMIYRALSITPEQSLNATTALNTVALMGGAAYLRVHDPHEACEARRMVELLAGHTQDHASRQT